MVPSLLGQYSILVESQSKMILNAHSTAIQPKVEGSFNVTISVQSLLNDFRRHVNGVSKYTRIEETSIIVPHICSEHAI